MQCHLPLRSGMRRSSSLGSGSDDKEAGSRHETRGGCLKYTLIGGGYMSRAVTGVGGQVEDKETH